MCARACFKCFFLRKKKVFFSRHYQRHHLILFLYRFSIKNIRKLKILFYRTFGSGRLNATRIVVADTAGRLSFLNPGGFDIGSDSRVRFHARTVLCAQVDQIRLCTTTNWRIVIIYENGEGAYRSRSYPEIGRLVVVHLLQR